MILMHISLMTISALANSTIVGGKLAEIVRNYAHLTKIMSTAVVGSNENNQIKISKLIEKLAFLALRTL